MTNLDSILKSRGISLPTKVHLVKPMVFPVVMYGCENRTVKKEDADRGAGSQREVITYLPLAESPQKETESQFS